LSSAARTFARGNAVVYLPIDGLIASLEDALAEIAEIRSRNPSASFGALSDRIVVRDERRELSECADAVERALTFACAYAKGPTR
jgi:hypothetical protein